MTTPGFPLGSALLGGAALLGLPGRTAAAPLPGSPGVHSVRAYGATGDGATDDTAAVQRAIDAALDAGGAVYFPAGNYRITTTLRFWRMKPVTVFGDGNVSNILWAFDGNLLRWTVDCIEVTIRDLKVSAAVAMSPGSAAISGINVVARTSYQNLLLLGDAAFGIGTGIHMGVLSDSNVVINCSMWHVKGVGIRIGFGSEIFVFGGHIAGDETRVDGSIGIHVTGNSGGVYLINASISELQEGVRIANDTGAGSNREIFLTHAILDSCCSGLSVQDASYVSWSGCWAASCTRENIHLGAGSPTVAIQGGTIFNAGALGVSDPSFGAHGMIVETGSFVLSGVTIRNNRDNGLWVPGGTVSNYTVTGCRIVENGRGARVGGSNYIFNGNVFAGNAAPNSFSGGVKRIRDNLGA